MGVIVGHGMIQWNPHTEEGGYSYFETDSASTVWYFFTDVYPSLYNGSRPLDPPSWWLRLFESRNRPEDTSAQAVAINNEIAAAAAPEVR